MSLGTSDLRRIKLEEDGPRRFHPFQGVSPWPKTVWVWNPRRSIPFIFESISRSAYLSSTVWRKLDPRRDFCEWG